MQKYKSGRRNFVKLSTMGLGALAIDPLAGAAGAPAVIKDGFTKGDKKLRIVCIGAHPGDPEFGCGGTMAKYSDAGHTVIFLYLTRGEASDPGKTFAEMAALRTMEAEEACQVLNARPVFAGQVDGNTILDKERNKIMSKLVMDEKPDVVFAQWPVDAHPDHQVTGLLALNVWVKSAKQFDLYFYEVNTGSETMAFVPTDYVDITSVSKRKKEAMFAHKTQNPVETYDTYFKPLEEFRGLEAGVKAAEAFIHFRALGSRTNIVGL